MRPNPYINTSPNSALAFSLSRSPSYSPVMSKPILIFCVIIVLSSTFASGTHPADLSVPELLANQAFRTSTPARQSKIISLRKRLRELRSRIQSVMDSRQKLFSIRRKVLGELIEAKNDPRRLGACPRGLNDLLIRCGQENFSKTRPFVCKVAKKLTRTKRVCGAVEMRKNKMMKIITSCRKMRVNSRRRCLRKRAGPYKTKLFLAKAACRSYKRSLEFLRRTCRRGDGFMEKRKIAVNLTRELGETKEMMGPMVAEKKEIEERLVILMDLSKIRPSNAPRSG